MYLPHWAAGPPASFEARYEGKALRKDDLAVICAYLTRHVECNRFVGHLFHSSLSFPLSLQSFQLPEDFTNRLRKGKTCCLYSSVGRKFNSKLGIFSAREACFLCFSAL